MIYSNSSTNLPNSCDIKMGLYEPKDPECGKCQRAAMELCQYYAFLMDRKTKTEIIDSTHVVEFEDK